MDTLCMSHENTDNNENMAKLLTNKVYYYYTINMMSYSLLPAIKGLWIRLVLKR